MARVLAVGGYAVEPLTDGWEVASVASGAADDPTKLDALRPEWIPASVPGTVASALRRAKKWDLDVPRNFDADDWWFRCRFASTTGEGAAKVLKLGGLATVADVWLNGVHLLRSENMFVAHEIDVTSALRNANELVIRFSSLKTLLDQKRPRPKWKTRLVDHQQLRWFRTTLLGRIPGWSPPVATVGPWRAVALETRTAFVVDAAELSTRASGTDGVASAVVRLKARAVAHATLVLDGQRFPLDVAKDDAGTFSLRGDARIANATSWWPHTHGAPHLYGASVIVNVDGADAEIDLGRVGFRSVELRTGEPPGDGFELVVNGVAIFCRGACWTTADIVDPNATPAAFRAALETARDCGMNMIRVGGTMLYEADAFYDLCDELGILVWQDFMFANMDYPAGDAAFVANVRREVDDTLGRLQQHPCVALLCGNSEIEQQASMLGQPRELWTNALFSQVLPELCARWRPDVPYWTSSPSGGSFPFQSNAGLVHYYGVGAYMRPLEDARRANVRFTSECLGFANVPENRTIERLLPGGESPSHHPRWKARTPRDSGAGWDFEDVRDHYTALLFGVEPTKLRYADIDRYLALARVTTGEVMARTFAEWRRKASTCNGALVWFYRDLWAGAGWGVVDSSGWPKAAYYYLKRTLAPVCVLASDEGLNGLFAHAVNDTAHDIDAELEATLYRHGDTRVTSATRALVVPARGQLEVHVDAMFEGFVDTTYAYRFGPPGHDVVVLALRDKASGARLGEAFYFPIGIAFAQESNLGLEAIAELHAGGTWALTLRTKRFAQSVAIDAGELWPEDNYVHLAPNSERTIAFRPHDAAKKPSGYVQALNAHGSTRITVKS